MPTNDEILNPKKFGIRGKNKPQAIIINSPWDAEDSAVSYICAKNVIEQSGYRVLNKRRITFNDENYALRPIQNENKAVTLFLVAHGLPGWLFGNEPSQKSELQEMHKFIDFIKELMKNEDIRLDNIVLSCCNSANEYFNPTSYSYFLSPARLLSRLFKEDIPVLGFIGSNTSAKITKVWVERDGKYEPVTLALSRAAVQYINGYVVEAPNLPLFCDVNEIPSFVSKDERFPAPFYRTTDAVSDVMIVKEKLKAEGLGFLRKTKSNDDCKESLNHSLSSTL